MIYRLSLSGLFLLVGIFSLSAQVTFTLDGTVKDLYTGRPMPSVNVYVQEIQKGTLTDTAGYFAIKNLKKGYYTLVLTRVGYKRVTRKVQLFKDIYFPIKMEEQAIVFEAQEITPGVTEMSIDEGASSTVSTQEIVNSVQVFSKDVYRALQTVPGISNSEWSSKPHVKGGNPDETAVIIDNLEIREPFHLEEIDGPYSVISSDLVKSMKVLTGGFAPKYGDRMSGLLFINTIDRIEDDSMKVSVDFSNATASLNQRINDRLTVFASGRKSYIFLLENAIDNNFPTTIWDGWLKADYKVDPKNRITVNYLMLNDNIQYKESDSSEFFFSTKTNYYLWLNWLNTVSTDRYSATTLGFQDLTKKAEFLFNSSFTDDNKDTRTTKLVTLKHDHSWKLNSNNTIEFGAEFNQFWSDYYFREFRLNPTETTPILVSQDIIFVDSKFSGYSGAAYFQNTYKVNEKLTALGGLRATGQSYANAIQLAPRAAMSYDFNSDFTLRLAYGWYYQPDNFQKLRSYANQHLPNTVPEKSIHYIASGIYKYDENTNITLDAYYKDYPKLFDDFTFDFSNRIEGVGLVDKPYQTVSGFATGFDLLMRHRYGSSNLFSLAYSLSTSHIRNERDLETYRDLDRTHSLLLSNIANLPSRMALSSSFRIRSGDPYTPSTVRILGDGTVENSKIYYTTQTKNSGRLPVFYSLDLRLEKRWSAQQMHWVTYVSVVNVTDHKNVRQRSWKRHVNADGTLAPFTQEDQLYFPRLFMLGISAEINLPRTR